jgi:hypothetical protein
MTAKLTDGTRAAIAWALTLEPKERMKRTRIPWKTLSVRMLRRLARLVGVKGRSTMNRAALVKELQKETQASPRTRKKVAEVIEALPRTQRATSTSKQAPAPPAAAPAPPAEPYIDRGKPVPHTYGRDVLRLMARDPEWVFAYWELTPQRLRQLRSRFKNLHTHRWKLRLFDLTAKTERLVDVFLGACSWYVHVQPRHVYKVELGFEDGDSFIAILSSNSAKAPANAISERGDEEWMILRRDLMRMLHLGDEQELFGPQRPHTSEERYREVTREQIELLKQQAAAARSLGASGGAHSRSGRRSKR